MFNKRVISFRDFIKESLSKTYWRNCSDDTNIAYNKEANDIANKLIQLMKVKNPKELIFTSSDEGFGDDYIFFLDIIKPLSSDEQLTLNMPGYIVYISLYTDPKTQKPIALVNTKGNDGSMTSAVYIKSEDFSEFSNNDDDVNEDPGVEDKLANASAEDGGAGAGDAGASPIGI